VLKNCQNPTLRKEQKAFEKDAMSSRRKSATNFQPPLVVWGSVHIFIVLAEGIMKVTLQLSE